MTFLPEYKRAKRIGRLFQDPLKGTAPNMTIEENLALAAGNGGWFSRLTQKDRARFRDRLALLDMGLEDRLNHPVGLLSGGQRQALTLLMACLLYTSITAMKKAGTIPASFPSRTSPCPPPPVCSITAPRSLKG